MLRRARQAVQKDLMVCQTSNSGLDLSHVTAESQETTNNSSSPPRTKRRRRAKSTKYNSRTTNLGESKIKNAVDDHDLETAVFGGGANEMGFEEDVEEVPVKTTKNKKQKAVVKPAWVDDDDSFNQNYKKLPVEASWATLPGERSESEHEDGDSDREGEDFLKTTGNYIASSRHLPSGVIQMKKCTDANKDSPASGKLKSVEFHPSAQVLLTAGMDQTLRLFQVDGKNNAKIQSVFLDKFPIHTAHFTPDGREVVMGSRHKSFYYYDMIAGKIVNVPQIKALEEHSMARFVMSPDGKYIAFLGKYGHIHLISAKSKEWIESLKMNGSVEAACFSRDSQRLLTHGDDGEVYVWNMTQRCIEHKFRDDGCIKGTSVAVSNNYIATGSYSGVVNIYDTATCMACRTPRPMKAIMNLTTPCTDMTFNPTAEILAIASNYTEHAVKLVHVSSMTVFQNFPEFDDNMRVPYALDFSVHGGYFTAGNHRGQALLYRVKHYTDY